MVSPRMMFSNVNMPSAKTLVSTAASIAASAMLVRSIVRELRKVEDLLPYELKHYLLGRAKAFFGSYYSSEITIVIEEYDGLAVNELYKAAELYLGAKDVPSTSYRVSLRMKETQMSIKIGRNQEIIDVFQGIQLKWRQVNQEAASKRSQNNNNSGASGGKYFQLKFHSKYKDMVFQSYFPFLQKESRNVRQSKRTLKLYTLNRCLSLGKTWRSVNLHHPATFDTLAMDIELKKTIKDDLDRFLESKDYYKKVGRAWKRGYLLYGPPGTGKSSLVGAMANYLNFHIYDLGLTNIHHNSELQNVLLATRNHSILVVEDIDCSLEFKERQDAEEHTSHLKSPAKNSPKKEKSSAERSQVTLSGFLNFIDGLWSSCGDARIIVFTTNHKEKLDPALLRPGRMDMHIHMSYCTPCAFQTLATNYLGITSHMLFSEIEELLKTTLITPAEVAEQLLKTGDPENALRGVIECLHQKKKLKMKKEEADVCETSTTNESSADM